ncbi:MAG: aminotransferase class I/II-fold pyridoxal phosphate-dependent enzyme, partial [Lachnospiraceae bacterium]|nr:aminotransferase class I/II-fold pyridoxal phosphate-dependent enzyme [Lachnospiraceae bacterium]
TIDFDLEQKAKDENTHILIFCNPHNPTGRVWTKEELERVGKICADNDMWIISDEIHCDLLRCTKVHTPFMKVMPGYKKLVTCMAPSKTFNMAGFMTSNIIIRDEELKGKWRRVYSSNINPMSLAGATAAFSKGDEWLEQLKAYLDKNFELVKEMFETEAPKVKFAIPEATYLAWADLSAYIPVECEANVPFMFAENGGVVIEYGKMFVDNGLGHVRINLAYPASVVKEGIKRVCAVLNKIEAGEIEL